MTAPALRPYQEAALVALESTLDAEGSALAVMATGTGKTPVIASLAGRFHARGARVLAVAQRRELLTQIAGAAGRFAPGMTVGIEVAERRVERFALPDLVVASTATLRGKRLASLPRNAFGLVICDEAHHAVSDSHRAIFDHFEAPRAGFTATPDRLDKSSLGRVFGTLAFSYDIRQAIEEGYLAPIRQEVVHVDGLDLSKVRKVAGELSEAELEEALLTDDAVTGMVVPTMERAAGRPGLVFGVTVAHARALATRLNDLRAGAAAVVHGAMTLREREDTLRAYTAGQVQFLCNVAVLTEGVDLPRTEVVAMARPTLSRSLYTQMVGRGTRLAPGKDHCLVIDFTGTNASMHRLVTVLDVLAPGEDDAVAELAQELMDADPALTLDRALVLARQQIAERKALAAAARAAERAAQERAIEEARREAQQLSLRLEAQARPRTVPVVRYGVTMVDPFSDVDPVLGVVVVRRPVADIPEAERATPGQVKTLEGAGLDVAGIDRATASSMIDAIFRRRDAGLCTLKQARTLARFGLPTNLRAGEASRVITAIADNGWRLPDDLPIAPVSHTAAPPIARAG